MAFVDEYIHLSLDQKREKYPDMFCPTEVLQNYRHHMAYEETDVYPCLCRQVIEYKMTPYSYIIRNKKNTAPTTYIILCTSCGLCSSIFEDEDKAIDDWNSKILLLT